MADDVIWEVSSAEGSCLYNPGGGKSARADVEEKVISMLKSISAEGFWSQVDTVIIEKELGPSPKL